MNVFEDLIVELKQENLLESTVADNESRENEELSETEAVAMPNDGSELAAMMLDAHASSKASSHLDDADQTGDSDAAAQVEFEIVNDHAGAGESPAQNKKQRSGREFFKKRAVDDVSSHQMVEHVLTGVEREYMKVVPKTFDDFNAKKALNSLVNISQDADLDEHKAAEAAVRQETEAWGMALIERDRNIAVSNLRRYCENSRPALSSQALLGLARFYRNAPYSESVRAKFDFVITRLFSRPTEEDKRVALLDRDAMLGHINILYSEWSSVPLYTADEDESNVLLTGLSFDDLAAEAESASHIDQLIASDFFGRLRIFKESISELFYAPIVTVAAIESNIRIGNAYVDLIVRERQKMDTASIQTKYGDFDEQTVSDAAGRTLDLIELLNKITAEAEAVDEESDVEDKSVSTEQTPLVPPGTSELKVSSPFVARMLDNALNVNRWLLVVTVVVIFLCGCLYVWSTYIVEETVSSAGVANIEMESTPFVEYVKTGRISREIFYGFVQPAWDVLPKEKRQELLQKILQAGNEKGYRQVALIKQDGKPAGYASATRLDVNMP